MREQVPDRWNLLGTERLRQLPTHSHNSCRRPGRPCMRAINSYQCVTYDNSRTRAEMSPYGVLPPCVCVSPPSVRKPPGCRARGEGVSTPPSRTPALAAVALSVLHVSREVPR